MLKSVINHKKLLITAAIASLAFLSVLVYWTVLPRTGTLDIPGEGIYTGQLRGMIFHGYGTYKSYEVGGTSYEGEWEDGVFHGQGTLILADGSKLSGNFVEGIIRGEGKVIYPEGHIRVVDFDNPFISDIHHDCDQDH